MWRKGIILCNPVKIAAYPLGTYKQKIISGGWVTLQEASYDYTQPAMAKIERSRNLVHRRVIFIEVSY